MGAGKIKRAMKIHGIDFTSRPSTSKPLTCLSCDFDGAVLRAGPLTTWTSFEGFEEFLGSSGPWAAGLDFPFGLPARFIQNIQWPEHWPGYVAKVGGMKRAKFRQCLDAYRKPRPYGDKEQKRSTDLAAGSISPQKLYGVPVGLMFFEGAPRLLRAGVTIPGLFEGDPKKIAFEAYPGALARRLIGRESYKQDSRKKQTEAQARARREILDKILRGDCFEDYGFSVEAPPELCADPSGDELDALLCAMQAAWAWHMRDSNYGMPPIFHPAEGWIADPVTCDSMRRVEL